MKFCTKCGHELNDEAVVCVNCGCMVNAVSNTATVQQTAVPSAPLQNQKDTLPVIMNFVSTIAAIISLFFSLYSVFESYFYVSIYKTSTYSSSYSASSYFHPDYYFCAVGFVFALITFIFGLVGLILSLVKKAGVKSLFSSIARMVFGLVFIILTATFTFY